MILTATNTSATRTSFVDYDGTRTILQPGESVETPVRRGDTVTGGRFVALHARRDDTDEARAAAGVAPEEKMRYDIGYIHRDGNFYRQGGAMHLQTAHQIARQLRRTHPWIVEQRFPIMIVDGENEEAGNLYEP